MLIKRRNGEVSIIHKKEENIRKPTILTDERFNSFSKLCSKFINFLPKEFPKIDKESFKKSLIIETRILDHNEFVIKNTVQKLGDGWGHIIFCSNENYDHIKSISDSIGDIEIFILEDDIKTQNDYNNLLLNIEFWEKIKCEKVYHIYYRI